MAAKKKTKPRGANRYTAPEKTTAPNWIWLIAGIIIGGFIVFLMKLEPKQDIRSQATNQPNSQSANTTTTENKPKFEFPQILAGKDKGSLTEEQAKALDAQRAAALLAGQSLPTTEQASPVTPTPKVATPTETTTPVQTPPQPTRPAPAPKVIDQTSKAPNPTPKPVTQDVVKPVQTTPPSEPLANMRFFLQVGSYPSQNDAESIRAQLLMSGQNARIETSKTANKTWYRVMVGPFKTRNEAQKAQKQLSSSGFSKAFIIPRQAK